jgi:hypothetical protein
MQPDIHLNYLAILLAIVAYIAIGFLWYGPLFGKAWAKEAGMSTDCKPDRKVFLRAITLMIIGTFLTVYVLAHGVEVWRPSTWNAGTDASNATYGFLAPFFVWVGYFVPVLLSSVAWENRSWKLFAINAGYYFVALLAAGMILAYG